MTVSDGGVASQTRRPRVVTTCCDPCSAQLAAGAAICARAPLEGQLGLEVGIVAVHERN